MKKLSIKLLILLFAACMLAFALASCGDDEPDNSGENNQGGSGECAHQIQPTAEKSANCTEVGNIAYYTCTLCGNIYKNEAGTEQITLENTVIPATGIHTDNNSDDLCDGCGKSLASQGLEFTLNINTSTYSVTGIGTCTDTDVIIPATYNRLLVTSIGSDAFSGCSGLTSITIPYSVTSIGSDAFSDCSNLQYNVHDNAKYLGNENNPYLVLIKAKDAFIMSCEIHENTKIIYESAFSGCTGLTSIIIPDSVTSIGNYAFRGCSGLTSITIPDSVTTIASDAFSGCTGLTSITVNEGNTVYHSNGNCLIETATKTLILGCKNSIIPTDGSVTSIGSEAFSGCSGLTSITIPESVTYIGRYAFYGCTGLSNITIPDSVTSIDDYAFRCCSALTSITIPDSVTSIGLGAFYVCTGLSNITIPDSVTSIGNYAFSDCSGLTNITIPESVTYIGRHAFYRCTGLSNITIPDSVTSIDHDAFYGCYKLVEVYNKSSLNITKGSPNYGYVGYYALNVYTPESGESKLDYRDDGYIFYQDGDVVYLLGYNGAKTDLILPDNYNGKNYEIYAYAFSGCADLKSMIIPNSVTSIGNYAFYGCTGLTSITIPDSVTSIDTSAFSGCTGLTSITIPDSVTSIGSSAFSGCSGLTSITIPDSVTSIGNFAFYGCSGLTSITIPDSVTDIGWYTFYGCTGLTSITIPDSVTTIASDAFYGCSGLTSITYEGTMEQWNAIYKYYNWNSGTGNYVIHCTDGDIAKS